MELLIFGCEINFQWDFEQPLSIDHEKHPLAAKISKLPGTQSNLRPKIPKKLLVYFADFEIGLVGYMFLIVIAYKYWDPQYLI